MPPVRVAFYLPFRRRFCEVFALSTKIYRILPTQYLYKQVMLTKVIAQAHIDHFTKWFERADKIVIVSHVSPDGDAWFIIGIVIIFGFSR